MGAGEGEHMSRVERGLGWGFGSVSREAERLSGSVQCARRGQSQNVTGSSCKQGGTEGCCCRS
jgi:hypothetical protein